MKNFDPIWNDIYNRGEQLNKYPYSSIVSFIFSKVKPIKKDGSKTEVLEIGCGAGNNLWFAAREGFAVTGLDASEVCLDFARKRFADEGLQGKFDLGDFTNLPYSNEQFDIAFERSALNQTPKSAARKAVAEILRVLKPGAMFYAEISSNRGTVKGNKNSDGCIINVEGPYSGYGQVCFYSREEIEKLFDGLLKIKSLDHTETSTQLPSPNEVLAHWSVLAVK